MVGVKDVYNKEDNRLDRTTVGEENKDRIYKYITEHAEGYRPYQIADALGLTRQTVQTHLRELIRERKVYKRNQRYFNNDPSLGNILNFARHMREASKTLFDPFQIYYSHSSNAYHTHQSVYHNIGLSLHKSIEGILDNHSSVVSQEYCKTNLQDHEMYEKYLFELANRIGAYLVYIFIEAMRPSSEYNIPSIKPNKKEELSMNLITKSLDIKMMFDKFLGYTLFDLANHGREFTNNTFDEITSAFKKVYPVVYEVLEECWSDSINTSINMQNALTSEEKTSNHKHKWEEFHIYKLKNQKYFVCRGCGHLVNEKIKNQIINQR
ncbi:MAG TPA: hypothetical protein VKA95_10450 [Nitrososphaeraceae archaeon]|nr:hypothetical protein [Nitrososphaeraceae archaeon]